jgi:ferredoxin
MARYRVAVSETKCQADGTCVATAPRVFAWQANGKSLVVDPGGADDAVILLTARSCPYRAITVVDDASGAQLFPPPRKA